MINKPAYLVLFVFFLPNVIHILNVNGSWFSKWTSKVQDTEEKRTPNSNLFSSVSTDSQLSWIESIQKKSEDELKLLEHGKLSLQKYESQGSDCYRDAALLLKNGCKELSLQQEEKIKYAVRLTLCEIATANIYVPQECNRRG
ncbi:hypothetical protein HMI55_000833 [Coelomomyces lativittatus]|nr:hypothetical protein HMI55_000833 [Coelomomyces lativittatus]